MARRGRSGPGEACPGSQGFCLAGRGRSTRHGSRQRAAESCRSSLGEAQHGQSSRVLAGQSTPGKVGPGLVWGNGKATQPCHGEGLQWHVKAVRDLSRQAATRQKVRRLPSDKEAPEPAAIF
jgi:hypothetical protein